MAKLWPSKERSVEGKLVAAVDVMLEKPHCFGLGDSVVCYSQQLRITSVSSLI
jgi:hypothetical protein